LDDERATTTMDEEARRAMPLLARRQYGFGWLGALLARASRGCTRFRTIPPIETSWRDLGTVSAS